jgi:hypothetical protein
VQFAPCSKVALLGVAAGCLLLVYFTWSLARGAEADRRVTALLMLALLFGPSSADYASAPRRR